MARPIAGVNDYPYGICGFIVDGAFIQGSKYKNLRIYKQRSDVMFDLINPSTGTIYQKLLITGLNINGEILDYSKSNDAILNEIPKNTFFVRGYNDAKSIEGFAIRFLLNKIILSSGRTLYNMYTPSCSIPLPDVDNIVIAPVTVDDTEITGTITSSAGPIDPTDMIVELTLPDGTVLTTTVDSTGKFTFSPVDLSSHGTGTATIVIKSPNYNEATATFPILDSDEDSDYVTSIAVSSADFVSSGDNYVAVIPQSLHLRGTDVVIQLQSASQQVFFSTVSVAANGDITITQDVNDAVNVVLIGKTLKSTAFKTALTWVANGDGTSSASIPKSQHNKENISFTVYDGTNVVSTEAVINSTEDLTLTSYEEFVGSVVIVGKA